MKLIFGGTSYEFQNEPFGRGGFVDVYKSKQIRKFPFVAKILKSNLTQYASACEAGYQKQRLLNTSGSFPCIEQIGYCDINGDIRLVVIEDFVPGITFNELVGKLNTDLPHLRRLFTKCAYALYILHGADVIHRDSHSGNIMLTNVGDVILLDFNTAATQGQHRETRESPAARIWGPFHDPSAPLHTDFTKKSDIFALGMVYAEQLTGIPAERIWDYPYGPSELGTTKIEDKLRAAKIPEYLTNLVVAMIQLHPSRRPDADAVLQALELQQFNRDAEKPRLPGLRDRSFGFVRRDGNRLEMFIRRRDFETLSLPPRSKMQLMVLNPLNPVDAPLDPPRLLVAPMRFAREGCVIMFAQANLPNTPGVCDMFIREIERDGTYTVLNFKVTRGFKHKPDTCVSFIISCPARGNLEYIVDYLDPLLIHLRRCIFSSVKTYMCSNNYAEEWENWQKYNNYETAVHVSATLVNAFHGQLGGRPEMATGYVGSTEYEDASTERYAVIRGFDIEGIANKHFPIPDEGQFQLIKVVPDGEHRDLVVDLCQDENYGLICLRFRCLLPTERSRKFIMNCMTILGCLLRESVNSHVWNIESFEMKDGLVQQVAGSRYSIRVCVHIGCNGLNAVGDTQSIDLAAEGLRIATGVRGFLLRRGGKSIEVFTSPLYGDPISCPPKEILKFAS